MEDRQRKIQKANWRQRHIYGWRAGSTVSCIFAILVLAANITITVWVTTRYPVHRGMATVFGGSCAQAKRTNSWLQASINVVSSILLGASNFFMQCLIAPTRAEVDRAHSHRIPLQIGVSNIRNLYSIGWDRTILWILLGLAALPLHLLYTVMAASQQFLDTGTHTLSAANSTFTSAPNVSAALQVAQAFRERIHHSGNFEKLGSAECLNAYAKQYVSSRGDVLLVQDATMEHIINRISDQPNHNVSVDELYHRVGVAVSPLPFYSDPTSYSDLNEHEKESALALSYSWQCSPGYNKSCDVDDQSNSSVRDWNPFGNTVKYCLSEKVQEDCKLIFGLDFACIVLVCNMLKILCMVFALARHRPTTLITIGDAISSFLDDPDPTTEGLCTYSLKEIECLWRGEPNPCSRSPFAQLLPVQRNTQQPVEDGLSSKRWRPKTIFWGKNASVTRWVCCHVAFLVVLIVVFISIADIKHGDSWSTIELRHMGIGEVVGSNIVHLDASMFALILTVNIPQTILSYFYIMFNNLYTCMVVGHEWSQYGLHRKPLRVSSPIGEQTHTYWLQLPYRYSIPMVIASVALSWLASQSLFFVQTEIRDSDGFFEKNTVRGYCYSPGALLLTMGVWGFIATTTAIAGLRRYPKGAITFAGTSSAAISAACHPPSNDPDASVLPVQWGVFRTKDGIGQCSFSSKLVASPIPGRRYGGTTIYPSTITHLPPNRYQIRK